tara:strand:- start:7575 stop:8159 length:585 start_codon:yes stop_codon:yes gene_type:complete
VAKKDIKVNSLLDYVVAIIPARIGSKRLPKKNIYPVWGKPMIAWSILAAKKSNYINDIFVSTDDSSIAKISIDYESSVINRPKKLADDKTYKMDVIQHAVKEIEKKKKPTLVISLQANSPEVRHVDLNNAIEHLINYDLFEVVSVDKNLNQNGAIRVMRYNTVFQKNLSVYFGVVKTNISDIHTLSDLSLIENK